MRTNKPSLISTAWDKIYRPIDLPHASLGQPAPCDLFNARGVLLIKAGMPIPSLAHDPLWPVRLFCEAQYATQFTRHDPQREMHQASKRLTDLSARLTLGERVTAGELQSLAQTLYALWLLDADACLGLARLEPYGPPSAWHALHVALLAAELAHASGLDESDIQNIIGGALSMNLSTLALHDEMYNLLGPLQADQRAALQRHPQQGVQCLQRIGKFQDSWLKAVASHHENIDGSGYPQGLQGTDICLPARIVRVADTLAARLTGRRVRPPQHWNMHHARDLAHLVQHIFGTDLKRLDPALTHRLLQTLSRFPPGSLVRLNNSELALVTRRHASHALPRQVLAIYDADGKPYASPRPRRIAAQAYSIRGYAHDTQRYLPSYDWKQAWGYDLAPA